MNPSQPKSRRNRWLFWAGFVGFYIPLFFAVKETAPRGVFIALVVDLPVLAFILALFRRTRQFGLGMFLAAAIFFATTVITCGRTLE
ncbi:MAG TPA: hypothetical protein VK737_07200 [Opitutales bacterium]|nr:hypothetical protein [Opitutales bacterium]